MKRLGGEEMVDYLKKDVQSSNQHFNESIVHLSVQWVGTLFQGYPTDVPEPDCSCDIATEFVLYSLKSKSLVRFSLPLNYNIG